MTHPGERRRQALAGEPLDPQAAEILWEADGDLVSAAAGTPAQALAAVRRDFSGMVEKFRGASVSPYPTLISDQVVSGRPDVRVRRYQASDRAAAPDVLLFIHGGGWVAGAPADLDYEMCAFARRLDMRVVSVDYRLAPENPYPAPLDDCMAVVRHLQQDSTVHRIAVAGDSAGGNLAAAVAIACRNENIPLAAQLLIYPALDPTQRCSSQNEFRVGYGLTKTDMAHYWASYLPKQTLWTEPTAAPTAATSLSGLAPAVVVTAGYDPLRDEGDAYASRLKDAAVPTTHLQNPSLPHAFLVMTGRVQVADTAVQRALDAFAQHLDTRISVTNTPVVPHEDQSRPAASLEGSCPAPR